MMDTDLFTQDKPLPPSAVLSDCGTYRYLLTRTWDASSPPLCWVMLNPSTADAGIDDPTIRRVVRFSRDFGYGGAKVVNLYALRSTSPSGLWSASDPVGPDNDRHILDETAGEFVVLAWGGNAKAERVRQVVELVRSSALSIDCLGLTKDGHPRHPLYLPVTATRQPFHRS